MALSRAAPVSVTKALQLGMSSYCIDTTDTSPENRRANPATASGSIHPDPVGTATTTARRSGPPTSCHRRTRSSARAAHVAGGPSVRRDDTERISGAGTAATAGAGAAVDGPAPTATVPATSAATVALAIPARRGVRMAAR
ncbi:MAG: hypothetical protein PGN29_16355 [Gordonia paraffinivorans]